MLDAGKRFAANCEIFAQSKPMNAQSSLRA